MIVWRVLAFDPAAKERDRGGMLWFPGLLQGAGRHDNPSLYGCLYTSENGRSAVAETLAPFRGSGALEPSILRRGGRDLWLGGLDFDTVKAEVLDLDDPKVLVAEQLRPSQVATYERTRTQQYAARLFESHERIGALRWWSTLESSLTNITIFDRAKAHLSVAEQRKLTLDDPVVGEAATMLGFPGYM